MTTEPFPGFLINLVEPGEKTGFRSSILHIFAKPALELVAAAVADQAAVLADAAPVGQAPAKQALPRAGSAPAATPAL